MPPQYQQKFRREWLDHVKLKGWLTQYENDPSKSYCKYCKCVLAGKLSDLINHSESQKHKSSASIRGSCWRKLDFKPEKADSSKKQEIALALFTCQHSSNNSVDHLTELCKSNFEDGKQIRMYRTKCTNIIKNVLSPHFMKELRIDIGNSKYSILIDESTDVGVVKLLEIENADSEGIAKVIIEE
ncbi:hypothetical protein FF38_11114 [Lucilia cuprina]|uniref:DUF4371 domain-containing protein n=1 Tax=Lucilia cuprina TaxID=7375 RepID=A0A0L0CU40_LUCCU|nr:hypothetical protein FF38_11114 [Lucilia cuprina]